MRRVLTAVLSFLLAGASHAAAASFVALPAQGESPSIIMLGEAVPTPIEALPVHGEARNSGPTIYVISGSVIAMGADAIPTVSEQVASIGEPAAPRRPLWMGEALPLVIRGGMVGDARPAPAELPPPAQAERETPAAQQPERRAAQRGSGPEPAPAVPDTPAPPVGTMR